MQVNASMTAALAVMRCQVAADAYATADDIKTNEVPTLAARIPVAKVYGGRCDFVRVTDAVHQAEKTKLCSRHAALLPTTSHSWAIDV